MKGGFWLASLTLEEKARLRGLSPTCPSENVVGENILQGNRD